LAPLWQNIKTYDTIIRINIKSDGSVYHLNLKPEHIAHNIIFVGDQNRVEKITILCSIEFSTQKKFKTKRDCSKARELV
jgi:uridine phosphorylase